MKLIQRHNNGLIETYLFEKSQQESYIFIDLVKLPKENLDLLLATLKANTYETKILGKIENMPENEKNDFTKLLSRNNWDYSNCSNPSIVHCKTNYKWD